MRISEVAKAVGVCAMTIRRYADKGIIKSFTRTLYGERIFEPQAIEEARKARGMNENDNRSSGEVAK